LIALVLLGLNAVAWKEYWAESQGSSRVTTTDGPRTGVSSRNAATLVTQRARPARVVLTATRGPCWLSIRRDSSTGKRLYLGILRRGRSLRLSEQRIWMHVGAGENVVARLNGRKISDFPEGVAEVTVTAKGLARI
jgi:hypothetical protein